MSLLDTVDWSPNDACHSPGTTTAEPDTSQPIHDRLQHLSLRKKTSYRYFHTRLYTVVQVMAHLEARAAADVGLHYCVHWRLVAGFQYVISGEWGLTWDTNKLQSLFKTLMQIAVRTLCTFTYNFLSILKLARKLSCLSGLPKGFTFVWVSH